MSLGKKTASGVVWNYVSFASGKLLTFISTIILARLLAPDQFGQVAIALLVLQYLDAIGDLGISAALIYQRDNIERAANVAFIISLTMGLVLAAVLAFGAPLIGAFFNDLSVVPMLQTLAVVPIINSLGQTQTAMMSKELHFKRKLLPDLSRSLAKGIGSIVLATMGFGAWSLIYGQMLGAVVNSALMWVVNTWRPRLEWDGALARSMLGYGWQIILIEILSVLWATADYTIVGKLLGRTDLALYQQSFRITDLLIINICFVVGRVLFPSYAKLNHDMDALRAGALTTVRYISLLTLPMSFGLAAVAPLFVPAVFGEQWLAMTPALQILAIRAGISTLTFNSGHVLRAIGRPGIINYQTLAKLVVLVIVCLLTVPYGFVAVALGQVGVALFGMFLDNLVMRHIVGISPLDFWRQVIPSLLGASLMGLVVWGLVSLIPRAWAIPGLLGAILAGALVYVAILWVTNRALCERVLREIRQNLAPRRRVAGQHS